jgi:hypothetical protein
VSALDAAEFARVLAEARAVQALAAAGLQPERIGETGNLPARGRELRGSDGKSSGVAPYREHAPAPTVDVEVPGVTGKSLNNLDYRITGNHNPVITRPVDQGPAVPPPSTLVEIEAALARYEASRPRSVQRTLGPSELGTPCRRQMALKLAGVERHERGGLPWAPMCGTAVHSLMESVLEAENARLGRPRWVIEETVQLDDELKGHGDAYDSDHALVIDWKYTGTTARRKASRKTVANADLMSPEYRVQAHLYGLGHENAGRPVRFVRVVMLARSHDFRESVEWTEEYRPDIALDAMTRFYATRDQVVNLDGATHPERLAAIEATPGDACKWCPFQRPGAEVDATGCVGNTAASTDPAAFFR